MCKFRIYVRFMMLKFKLQDLLLSVKKGNSGVKDVFMFL